MQATLSPKWPHKFPLRACAGTEFTPDQWVQVPPSHEREALRHEFLVCRDESGEIVTTLPATTAESTPVIHAAMTAPDYDAMTKRELQVLATQRHLEFRANTSREELLALLKGG